MFPDPQKDPPGPEEAQFEHYVEKQQEIQRLADELDHENYDREMAAREKASAEANAPAEAVAAALIIHEHFCAMYDLLAILRDELIEEDLPMPRCRLCFATIHGQSGHNIGCVVDFIENILANKIVRSVMSLRPTTDSLSKLESRAPKELDEIYKELFGTATDSPDWFLDLQRELSLAPTVSPGHGDAKAPPDITIHLQGIGRVAAKPATDIVKGDVLIFNYGHMYEVVGITSTNAMIYIDMANNKDDVFRRLFRKTTMIGIV